MYRSSSLAAYDALHKSKTHRWSVPDPSGGFPNLVEPPFGGFRIFGDQVCSELTFTPRFELPRNAKIFTIGSCFARNVEEALLAQGFSVLTRESAFSQPHGYLNRYNTAAMSQEIEFAIGSRTFDDRSVSSMAPRGFADLTAYGHFESPQGAIDLRRETTALFKGIFVADFVIITAGLSEVWYDKTYGYYTNIAPTEAALLYPDRFEFRLLSYAENFQELRRLVDLIRENRPGCKIVMTVSPVPLNATFIDRDVLISNSYSKACLRAAVEQIQWEYDCVDYFPSFEMVNLSDPAVVWESDRRHVKQSFVNTIMAEFSKRYISS